jgi:hypothetical protein
MYSEHEQDAGDEQQDRNDRGGRDHLESLPDRLRTRVGLRAAVQDEQATSSDHGKCGQFGAEGFGGLSGYGDQDRGHQNRPEQAQCLRGPVSELLGASDEAGPDGDRDKQQAGQRGGSGPSDLGECAPRFQAILDLDAMDANYLSPGGESGQRTAAAGLPVAARRARSEVPVIATVIAVTM